MDSVRKIRPVIRLQQFDEPRKKQPKRKQPESASALNDTLKHRTEEEENDIWFVQGKKYSNIANKYGEEVEAEVGLSA